MIYAVLFFVVMVIVGLIFLATDRDEIAFYAIASGFVAGMVMLMAGTVAIAACSDVDTFPVKFIDGKVQIVEESNMSLVIENRRSFVTWKDGVAEYTLYDTGRQVVNSTKKDDVLRYLRPKTKSDDSIFEKE